MVQSFPSSGIYMAREHERQELLALAAREQLARRSDVQQPRRRALHARRSVGAARQLLGATLISVGEAVRGSLPRGMTTDPG